jgi:hypothetical protein
VYPVVDGIPVLLIPEAEQTHWFAHRSLEIASGRIGRWPRCLPWSPAGEQRVHPYVADMIVKTNGMLYSHLRGKLTDYPIPEIRLPRGRGRLLDIGCNWGRWSIAAARKGYSVTGIDPDLYGVMAARDVSRQLGVAAEFVVGDGRFLPFPDESFDVCFSYSVVQHLSLEDAATTIGEIARMLRAGATSLVQMANRNGVRSLYHLSRRRFAKGNGFDVRYWSPTEMKDRFEARIGPSKLAVDGFFGLGVQAADRRFMPVMKRGVIGASEMLRPLAAFFRPLVYLADSIYVESTKRAGKREGA